MITIRRAVLKSCPYRDEADGTYLAFGPDVNLPRLLGWLGSVHGQMTLFGGDAA